MNYPMCKNGLRIFGLLAALALPSIFLRLEWDGRAVYLGWAFFTGVFIAWFFADYVIITRSLLTLGVVAGGWILMDCLDEIWCVAETTPDGTEVYMFLLSSFFILVSATAGFAG